MSLTKDGFWKQIGGVIGDNRYVLLAGGGHTLISSLSVANANKIKTISTENDRNHYLTFVDSNNNPNADYEDLYTNDGIYLNPSLYLLSIGENNEFGDNVDDSYNSHYMFGFGQGNSICGYGSFGVGHCVRALGDGAHAVGEHTIAYSHAHAEGWYSQAINDYSHAEGYCTTASGEKSHTEGHYTEASRTAAHAEGYSTLASGLHSHAEGNETIASGNDSHAEGNGSESSGKNSHAEGNGSESRGMDSHAEGYSTLASGLHSHAEGHNTEAHGQDSHAEGEFNLAIGENSHVEGSNNIANGDDSHVEGLNNYTYGNGSHAEGSSNKSYSFDTHTEGFGNQAGKEGNVLSGQSGQMAHAEGYYTTASGTASHSEGKYTLANGSDSHAEGYHTEALGEYSHAEGRYTTTFGKNSHAEGYYTIASYISSHAEGSYTMAYSYSHAEGYNSYALAYYSHAEGYYTTTYGLASHTSGSYTIANNDYEAAFGIFNQSNSDTIFSVGNGTDTTRRNVFEVTTGGTLKRYNFTILDTGNSSVSGGGNTLGSSITVTINNVPITLTIPSSINWSDITGKPSTFSPSTHEHNRIKINDDRSKYPAQLTGNTTQALFGSFMNNSKLGINTTTYGTYSDALVIRGYLDSTGGKENAIIFNKNSTNVWHTQFDFGSTTSWGTPYMFLDTNNWADVVDGRYLKLSGGTMTGNLTMGGIDLCLGTSSSSSNDSADLVFLYGNGNEKLRIWADDTYTTIKGPNVRAKKSDGTELYSTTLALSTHTHPLSITSDSGTSSVTLSHNTTYKLTAGGSTFIFKTPSDNNNYVKQEDSTTSNWRPLLLGYNSNNTVNSGLNSTTTNQSYLSNKLCFQPSTGTLAIYGPLWLRPDGDATLKIYSGRVTDAYSDGFIKLQTSIDGTDGSSHSYPGSYQARCALFLQPRGGEVYIGKDITSANTSADTNYKLNVGGAAQFDGNIYSGLTTSTIEQQIGVKSINGDFYMFAQGSSGSGRGICVGPHGNGVGKALIYVDADNNVTFEGTLNGTATSANYLGWYDGAYTNPGYGTGSLSYYSYYNASYAMSSSVNGKSNPTSGWYHHLLMIHPDSNGYFCDVAWELTNSNDPKMYYRVRNSSYYSSWVSVLTNKNYTSYIENYLSDLELTIAASLNDLNSRINSISSGNASITHNTTSSTTKRYILGAGNNSQPNNNTTINTVYSSSNFYFNHSGAYHASDIRKKYDIRDILNEDVNKLFETENGFIRHFKWKESSVDAYGFIAQELLEYCPEAVDMNDDDGYYAVNYNVAFSKIIGAMFKKIKELENKLKENGIS